jgi:hypothetical protein
MAAGLMSTTGWPISGSEQPGSGGSPEAVVYQLNGTDGSTFNLSSSAKTAIAAGAITVKTAG